MFFFFVCVKCVYSKSAYIDIYIICVCVFNTLYIVCYAYYGVDRLDFLKGTQPHSTSSKSVFFQ